MLQKEDTLQIQLTSKLSEEMRSSLSLLYTPCMGKEALACYLMICSCDTLTHTQLCTLLGCSVERLEEIRGILEQYQLVSTYVKKQNYIWKVNAPLLPITFLKHEIYGRVYMDRFGLSMYETMKSRFEERDVEEGYTNISKRFMNMDSWDGIKERSFQTFKPKAELPASFDYATFLQISTLVFPKAARSKENLAMIGRLAIQNGISANEMKKWVGKAYDLRHGVLDVEKLRYYVLGATPDVKQEKQTIYHQQPIYYLKERYPDVPISEQDRKIIFMLLNEYEFSWPVANVLLAYALEQCDHKLVMAYVKQVANTWKRKQIDTYELALAETKQEKQGKLSRQVVEKALPDWFYQQTDENVEVDEAEVANLLASLGGE